MPRDIRPFRNLNAGNLWPGFHWDGLQLAADGTLSLESIPKFDGLLPDSFASLPARSRPSGIAVDRDSTVFFTNCVANRLLRINTCSLEAESVPCLAAELSDPAGLLIPEHRRALYLADSGNGRVLVFHLDSLQLLETFSGFQRPVSLASDSQGALYVVDTKAHRLDRITISGDRVPSFWQAVAHSGRVADPRAVAGEGDLIYVLDGQTHNVCWFNPAGELLGEADTSIDKTSVFTVIAGVLYVADPGRRRIAVFRRNQQNDYIYVGDAAGYEGPVRALAPDRRGGLLVSPACEVAPRRLTLGASFSASGLLWSDALDFDGQKHFWNRLHATVDLGAGANLQFFVFTGAPTQPPPTPGGPVPFPAPWRPIAPGVTDFFIGGDRTQALWIGAHFTNDLDATPVLGQLRVDFDQESYLPYLPAIYRERDCDDFLLRFISLFESLFDEVESKIDRLPALLDPAAVPAHALPWLAGFLALALPETWNEREQREAIATVFARYARRGTVAGLREALRIEAGVRAVIDEPIQAMGWWSLPAHLANCRPDAAKAWAGGTDSALGFNTVLPAGEPQGAVVGTTATLDRSQLTASDQYGQPLFEAAAYWFTVSLYPGEVDCPGKLDRVIAIIDREKPAHTMYEVCVVQPGLRIGYQSRLGVDTLVGGARAPTRLGEGGLVLAGQPRGQLGLRSQVGVDTHL